MKCETEYVVTKDGTKLATDVYIPEGAGPWPTILVRTGYGRDSEFIHPNLPLVDQYSYVVVSQDVRGLGGSSGRHELFHHDAADASDTLDWITSQQWSNGRVGMIGASYLGATQWLAAGTGHSALEVIAPTIVAGVFDGYGYHSPGVVQLDMLIAWVIGCVLESEADRASTTITVPQIRTAARAAADATDATSELLKILREQRMDDLPAAMQGVGAATVARNDAFEELWKLPLAKIATEVSRIVPWVAEWIKHPDPADGYWDTRDHTRTVQRVTIPAIHVGGWNDVFIRGTLRQYRTLTARSEDHSHRLVIHPFGHTGPGQIGQVPLEVAKHADPYAFGGSIVTPADGLLGDFIDAQLRGTGHSSTGAPVSIFVMGRNEWRDEQEWPLAREIWTKLHLRSDGEAAANSESGALSPTEPAEEHSDTFEYDPRDPVPSQGGTHMGFGRQPGFFDQSEVESRGDVLTYTSAPLKFDLEVTGHPYVELWAATSCVDTDFTARIVDVDPDGSTLGICDGVTRLRFRPDHPGLVEPGSVQQIRIEITPTSYVFAAGHRIRLQISSSNFPLFDPNPNTGGSLLVDGSTEVAHQIVYHDAERPSALHLPVIPG
ncbi:CocE/NonD family hydrolase [Aeromicrobium panaciterrae]